jgi:hypothetical protein
VRQGAEEGKANPGTGGIPSWLAKPDNPAKKGSVPNHYRIFFVASKVRRTGSGGKSIDVTQGGLIAPLANGKLKTKTARVKVTVTVCEKSEVGIVVSKSVRKAAKADESASDCRCKPGLKRPGLVRSPNWWKRSAGKKKKKKTTMYQTEVGEPGSAKNRGRTNG